MAKITTGYIINTSIISAFTIATALIWKDVIIEVINKVVPPGERLLIKFLAAVISTVAVIVAIYLILETEKSAGSWLKRFRKKGGKTKKGRKTL